MAENNETVAAQQMQDNAVNIKDVLHMCLARWYWFVISLVVCLTLAIFYLLRTPPVYTQTASILIKETPKSRAAASVSDSFQSFGMFSTNVNISNEIITMKSSTIMEEVVKRLKLEMNYSAPGRWHAETLYGPNLPLEVDLPDVDNKESASLSLHLEPGGKLTLSDFKLKGEDVGDGEKIEAQMSDTIATPLGRFIAHPSKYFKADDEGKININKSTLIRATTHYRKELTVTQGEEKASVIILTVNDVSIRRADDILATLISVYNENWVEDKNRIAVSTSMFISDRLGIIENELGDVDSDISSFKSEHLIADVETAANMYMTQANQAQSNIQDLNNKVYMAQYIRNYLANNANDTQVLPVTSGVDNVSLAAQITDYNNKMLERNSLASYSSDKNPLIVEMDKGLKELRNSMIASIDNQIISLNAQIASFQNTAGRATSQIASNPGQAKYLLSVERKQKVKESLYLYLLQKREENALSQAFTAYNTRIIDNPGGSPLPTSPRRMQIMLIAFVLGIAIPLGIVYLKEMFNTVVRGRKDIESLSLPFVGEIPECKSSEAGSKKKGKLGHSSEAIVVKEGSRNIINEAFRVVRTNIEFMLDQGHHIVALTSANPGSGKTFITFNLADSLALKGKRVIAIDFDLRKGSLSHFAPKSKVGIADYLAGRTDDINDILLKQVSGTKVDLIPLGTMPPNPTELLFSPKLPDLLETLKAHYDYVFLDCPPVEMVADAAIISQMADKTIFVIRAGLFERSMLSEVEHFYTSGRYKNLCVLLNGTEISNNRYYSKYGRKYGYRYGYKYGSYITED